MSRKMGPVRQLSLQCEPQGFPMKRAPLKKQFSEEIPEGRNEGPIRISLSAKSRTHVEDRPAPVKIAWSEDTKEVKNGTKVQIQRDTFYTKDTINSLKITQKDSLNNSILQKDTILSQKDSILAQRDSILSQKNSILSQKDPTQQKNAMLIQKDTSDDFVSSKHDLAERLRLAWKDRDKSKQNLSIFLTHKSNDEECAEFPEEVPPIEDRVPKIMPLTQNEMQQSDLKQIFRKHISRTPSVTTSYSPTRTDDDKSMNRSDAIVVVPIIERPKITKQVSLCETSERVTKLTKQTSLSESPVSFDNSSKLFSEAPAVVASRPSTAAGKREMFQKRTNSAFQSRSDGFRPPLIRASSVPAKPENKPKFLATKRRLRVPKKRDKIEEEDKLDAKRGDIVTMVSLVSPSGSDCEEEVDKPPSPVKDKEDTPPKTPNIQRKLPKSVSFQHSSIHSVRSFSASFPSRRGSIATALLIGNASKKLASQKINEKRGNDEEQIGPKRRLLRAASLDTRSNHVEESSEPTKAEKSSEIPSESSQSTQVKNEVKESPITASPEEKKVEEEEDPKEKECWNMYCKMNQRGLAVSFDTILRGMLTPTEYRIRRKIIEKREAEMNPPTTDE